MNDRYRTAILQRQVVKAAKKEKEQFTKAVQAAKRVAELEVMLTSLERKSIFDGGYRQRKERMRQTRTRLALARDARDSLLAKILPAYRAVFDASELAKMVEGRLAEKEKSLTEVMEKWLHFLPPLVEPLPRSQKTPPLFEIMTYEREGLSLNMTRLPGIQDESGSDIQAFWVANTVITQDWMTVIAGDNPSHFKGQRRPVESINWYDAIRFCNLMSDVFGLERVYDLTEERVEWNRSANGFRLPMAFVKL